MKIINNSFSSAACILKGSGVAAIALGLAAFMSAPQVSAHGYVSSPKSRVIVCKEDGVESPKSASCKAALAAGNMGLYTPDEVSVIGVKDNHRNYIPDGHLCSANRSDLFGMDLARNDWKSTPVNAGPLQFVWTNTAQHETRYFRYYITRDGYDPTKPLKWDDLDLIHDSGRAGREATSRHTVTLPYRTGRHVVYSIWQREWTTDAPEAFYQCIDVIYGGEPNSSSSASSRPVVSSSSSIRSSSSSVLPSSSSIRSSSSSIVSSLSSSVASSVRNTCDGLPEWNATADYNANQVVQSNGRRYSARWWTRGQAPATNAGEWGVWIDAGACVGGGTQSSAAPVSSSSSSAVVRSSVANSVTSSVSSSIGGVCTSPVYANGTSYAAGALVQNSGSEYRCTVAGWCSTGGPYAPGSGWAWSSAWSLVRSCQ